MPCIITHKIFAEKAFMQLNKQDIIQLIDNHAQLFYIGSNVVHTSFAHRLVGTVILALSERGEIPRRKNKIISSCWPKGATIPLMFRSIQAKRVQCKRTRQ